MTRQTPNPNQQAQAASVQAHRKAEIETARHMAKQNQNARAAALQAGKALQSKGVQQAPPERQQYQRPPQPQMRPTQGRSL